MEILLPILLGLLLGAGAAAVVAIMIVRNEKQQNQLLQNNIRALREEKDMLTRSEATIAAHLTNAEQTIANIKEQHKQEKENQQHAFQTELALARESMRAHFE